MVLPVVLGDGDATVGGVLVLGRLGEGALKSERERSSPLQFFSMYSVRSANWFWSLVPVTSSVSKVFPVTLTVCWSTTVWESVRREMT